MPGLIEDITLAALDNGLVIESIDLQPERKAEFYVELPITIVVSGEYHNIGAFVSACREPVADRHAARFQHQTRSSRRRI